MDLIVSYGPNFQLIGPIIHVATLCLSKLDTYTDMNKESKVCVQQSGQTVWQN